MDTVIFTLDLDAFPDAQPGTIIITPSKENWNDFGFRIRVDIAFITPREYDRVLNISGFFGFIGESKNVSDVRLLRKLLENAPDKRLSSKDIPPFFTMLPNMGAYRDIVAYLGPELATKSLLAMNEVVAMDDTRTGPGWLRDAKQSRVFKQAFLRTSEAFFAWTNAGPVLHGLEHEQVGQISDTFNVHFQLEGRPNAHDLSFRFNVNDSILPRRFAVVIGENGVGKSQTLSSIARAALDGTSHLTDGDGERPSVNRLLAFTPTSTTSSVFPSDRRRNPKIWYRRFALGQSSGVRDRYTTADMILRLARTSERIGTNNRLNLFLKAIRAIEGWHELGLHAVPDYEHAIIYLNGLLDGGEQERIERFSAIDLRREPARIVYGRPYPLSSGEQSFLRFAAIASLYIENGTLVLLDEPETHLHPNFISQFVAVLDTLLELTGSAAIIATHSVYFVRESFEDQVIILRSERDRSIIAERPVLKTFGADVGSISYFVFGEDEPSRLAREAERRIAGSSASWTAIFEHYKDEISLDLLAEIRARLEPPKPASRS
ncbi:AAA family ATPase [Sphingomonas abietis]|uniref:AAA family ATPase n=1 Tax=Sphingomonas abietis TaxID=3012344 RepID=A0ABY7NRY5_9SPHN|nr:AAA family ATPase [Sphingomonas abietis]WBO22724.1 AAA family ATPase [Sphingomonas abietis]